MSRARDLGSAFSSSSSLTSDTEVSSYLSTINSPSIINPTISLTNNVIYAAGLNKDYMVKSYDGTTWTQLTFPGFCYRELRIMNGKFCAIGTYSNSVATTAGLVYSNDNGLNWTTVTLPVSDVWKGGGYINNKYVVVGINNAVYSTDLVNWTTVSFPDLGSAGGYENYWNGVKLVNGRMYAFRDTLGLYTDNGTTWNTITYPVSNMKNIIYANNKYTLIGTNNSASSTDGLTNWVTSAMPSSGSWEGLAYGNGVYVAHKEATMDMAYSSDAVTWSSSSYTAASSYSFSGIQYFNGKFIGLTDSSADFGIYSTNGITWTNFTKGVASGEGFNVLLPTVENATVSTIEMSQLDGVASSVQAQLNARPVKGRFNYAYNAAGKVTGISGASSDLVSTSITTNGYPVHILVTGDAENGTAGAWAKLQLFRGTTAIGNIVHVEGSAGSENIPFALQIIDSRAAGTYTYSLKTIETAGGSFNFGETSGPVITVLELGR